MIYRVFLSNHGFFLQDDYATLASAIEKAKSTTFDCEIFEGGTLRASYSFFGGLVTYS